MLRGAGFVSEHAEFELFDFLDRAAPRRLHTYLAYLITGHPKGGEQDVEASMLFANGLGIRVMLSEFSPIPGTSDGEYCRRWVDLDEPLWHNKTAFTARLLGAQEINRQKNLASTLNLRLQSSNSQANPPNRPAPTPRRLEKI